MAITVTIGNLQSLIDSGQASVASSTFGNLDVNTAAGVPGSVPVARNITYWSQVHPDMMKDGYLYKVIDTRKFLQPGSRFHPQSISVEEFKITRLTGAELKEAMDREAQRKRQENDPIGNNGARPTGNRIRGGGPASGKSNHGGFGPALQLAGGTLVPASTGGAGDRVQWMNQNLSTEGFFDPDGTLSDAAQASLVSGLPATEVLKLVAFLDPDAKLSFQTLTGVDGQILYYNATLISTATAATLGTSQGAIKMNFPTIVQYARAGYPIARSSWGGAVDSAPTTWLTFEGGVWYHNSPEGRTLVTSYDGTTVPNITAADLLGTDWMLPPACAVVRPLNERPSLVGAGSEASAPKFDVYNPSCKV
jgi:hypothetical protein